MKILVVISTIDISFGGTSRSSTSVISKLSEQFPEVEITLLTRYSNNPVLKAFNRPNAQIIFSRSILLTIFQNIRLFRGFDIVHIQGLWSLFPIITGILVKLLSKSYLIVSPRGMLEPWSLQQGRIKKNLALRTYQGFVFKLTDVFHVTAKEESTSLNSIVPNNKNIVIPNGIDMARFVELEKAKTCNKTILFLSRIHKKKGIEMLIDAWSILYKDWPNWQVRIVGDGNSNYIESLRQLILVKQLENITVDEPAYDQEKLDIYSLSDLFVLPSYSENFGIVVAEALASGIPVITTTGTPWSELVINDCGEYIEPTTEELVLALKKWMRLSSNQRKQAGQRGRELIRSNYSLDIVANSFYKLYERVLD